MVIEALAEVSELTVQELATRLRERDLRDEDVVQGYVSRAMEVQRRLNPIAFPMFESALETARSTQAPSGALAGIPISIKDQFLVFGTPSTWGLAHRADHRASAEGTAVRRLRAAGAIPLAKTNVSQLLLFMESDNPRYGRTLNPWDPERSPGGSSGGEACLVATRGSAMGLGGDLGGSIRVPAHFCGVHGFAPSEGRLPLDDNPTDIMPPSFGVEPRCGPIARRVDDLILAMAALAPGGVGGGSAPELPPISIPASVRRMRVGWYDDDGWFPASPAIRRATAEAAASLDAAGAEVVRFDPPDVGTSIRLFAALGIDPADLGTALAGERPMAQIAGFVQLGKVPRRLRGLVRVAMRAGGQTRLADALATAATLRPIPRDRLLADLDAYRRRFARTMAAASVDVLVCPPYATPAFRHGQGDQLSIWSSGSYATLFSALGFAAGVVAATRVREGEESDRSAGRDPSERAARAAEIGSAGLPVGVQIAAPVGQDGPVLAVMAELERSFRAKPDYPDDPARRS